MRKMRKWLAIILVLFLVAMIIWRWDWIMALRNEDLSYLTEDMFGQWGYGILLFTIPLMMVQNVVTLFPILILIVFHFVAFGVWGGILASFVGTFMGAAVCFFLARSAAGRFFDRYWKKNEDRLKRVIRVIDHYGVYMLVLLRSIPVMPSNLISIAAAASPISTASYLWSTVFGNLAMIGVLSFISLPLWVDESGAGPGYVFFFSLFFVLLIGYFLRHLYNERKVRMNNS